MQRTELAVWIGAAIILWLGISWYWYACSIKGFCPAPIVQLSEEQDGNVVPVQYREDAQVASMYSARTSRKSTRVTTHKQTTITCPGYLTSYIRYGHNNQMSNVVRLERYLNEYEGEDLDVDGVYSKTDEQAVMRFQEKYREDIMDPWGMSTPSGYVYSHTLRQINALHCAYEYAKQH